MSKIDIKRLREEMLDEYISEMHCGSSMDAMIEMELLQHGTDEQVLEIAKAKGIDISVYAV